MVSRYEIGGRPMGEGSLNKDNPDKGGGGLKKIQFSAGCHF